MAFSKKWYPVALAKRPLADAERQLDYCLSFGRMAETHGDYAAALTVYQEAIKRAELRELHLLGGAFGQIGMKFHHTEQDAQALLATRTALRLFRKGGYPAWTANTLGNLGEMLMAHGRTRLARLCFASSLQEMRAAKLEPPQCAALYRLGWAEHRLGNYPEARQQLNAALGRFREAEDKTGASDCLALLGQMKQEEGLFAEGREQIEQAILLYTEMMREGSRAAALGILGDGALQQGKLDQAERRYGEALAFWEQAGHRRWQGESLARRAALAFARGDAAGVTSDCARALELCPGRHGLLTQAAAWHWLGRLATRQSRFDAAAERLEESRAVRAGVGYQLGVAESLEALSELAQTAGEQEKAAEYGAEAARLRQAMGVSAPR